MNSKVVKLAAAFMLVSACIFGQPQGRNFDPANSPKESKLSGKVIDNTTSAPIEYATIGIYSMRDSSVISGGITDATGTFKIENLPYGRFYVEISFLGFTKSRINGVLLTPAKKEVYMGDIKLEPTSETLKEVDVVGNKNPIEYRIDKKVISVSQDIASAGGTAIDVLQNTPSVQVDVEGNVSLRGSSNFTVLIDGKPSVLKGSEALQQLPASSIQNIEIITNPSAKYDPSGTAGIINIIMKKSKQAGINGVINASVATNGSYSSDFLINLRKGNFNYYLGADINNRVFKNSRYINQETFGSTDTTVLNTSANGKFSRNSYGLKGGMDITLNDKNSVSFSGNIHKNSFGRAGTSYLHEYNSTNPDNGIYYIDDNDPEVNRNFYELSADHTIKFNDSGHQLYNSVNFSNEEGSDNNILNEFNTDKNWIYNGTPKFKQITTENETEREFRFKSDYSLPINDKSKFEAGYQFNQDKSTDDYKFYDTTSVGRVITSEGLFEDVNQRNSKDFTQNVHSLYSTYSNSIKSFDFQAGLRVEYMYRNLKQLIKNTSSPFEMWDYFPSLHVSKKLPHDFQVQASYTKRINRPDERDLDPFVSYMDTKHVRKGNPDLKPEYTNSYELNFQKSFLEVGFISIEGFHRQTKNLISRWIDQSDTTNNLIVMTSKNINRDYSTGTEIMLNTPLAKWWVLNTSASIYHYKLDGDSLNASNSTVTWNARFSSMFRFKFGMQLQLTGFYNAPSITPQGTREGFFFTNVGIRQDILNKKITLGLQVRDIFNNSGFRNTVSSANSYIYSRFMRETRVVTFTISYKLNNYKQKRNNQQNNQFNESDFDGGGMM